MRRLKEYYKKNKIDIITGTIASVIIGFIGVTLLAGVGRSDSGEENVSGSEAVATVESDSYVVCDDETKNGTSTEEVSTEEPTTSLTYKELNQKLYSTISLNVRNLPSEEGEVIGYLSEGQKAYVTGRCNETGWYRIDFEDTVGYVCDEYMVDECPVEAPTIVAEAAIVYDVDTGEVLYEKNADKRMYPASLTKIMTTLIACERGGLDEMVTFSENCKAIPYDSSIYGVRVGETVTLKDSLHMLMLVSANDVGVGIAEHISGTEAEFAKLMTKRAKELGANNTNFVNSHGYHDENHYTTARDLMLITLAGLKSEDFVRVWEALEYTVPATNKVSRPTKIKNIHKMLCEDLAQYYEYALGGKTGFHDDAGRCAITTAKKDGRTLLCVTMKSTKANQYKDGEKLFEYCFKYR